MPDKKKSILVVEDEAGIADILLDYLRQSGFDAKHKDTGAGVVDLVRTEQPDLILLDVMLPVMDGLEICREIRKFSEVPIIIISARVDELDRLLGLELGADDYICKPFSPREVILRIKSIFKRAQNIATGSSDSLFHCDEPKNRITVNGQTLDLTPTEYRLLKQFMSKPGRVYSRAQLLELCYDKDDMVFDRVIDSHIKNLRKKVAKALPDMEVIHAVYGSGYRFEIP